MAGSAYLSLAAAGGGQSSPILFGSNPMGDALLSTGVMALAGAAAIAPVLPVLTCGLDVRERVCRLDADALVPTPERGVTGANRIGEPLGSLTMRWLVAPDGFEATPSTPPQKTELDASRSQRFVMHDGVLRFDDRTQSGVRFFGAGRTYPVHADGATRLLFAGAAVVLEGLGSLKGLRGSLSLIGEVSGRSLVSLIVTGRFDDDGPLAVVDRVGLMIDSGVICPGATVLTMAGESNGHATAGHVEECIRIARIENDLANATQPRSSFRVGDSLGHVAGPLRFDPSDHRCAVRLIDGRRELTFCDAGDRVVGTIVADALEGTAFLDRRAGDHASRVIAYGRLSAGTGALQAAGGILTMDMSLAGGGAAASAYTLWLVDDGGRFRAPAFLSEAVPGETVSSRDRSDLRFDEATGASMLPGDIAMLTHAQRTLTEGTELNAWFEAKRRTGDYRERFDVARDYTPEDETFGFFDVASIGGSELPVMGIVQAQVYDRLKLGSPEPIRAQLEEFVLRYFLRVCHVGEPEAAPARQADSALQRAMSWLPGEAQRPAGTGYEQLYYQLAATGRVGKFARAARAAVVDLREIGTKYDWVLLNGEPLALDVPFASFGVDLTASSRPAPPKQATYLLLGPALITKREDPEPNVLADYGLGYAFVPYAAGSAGPLAYAPGRFRAALQRLNFQLTADGVIRVRTVFIVTRPEKIAAVDVDPIGWSMQLADLMTFRMASRLMSPVLAMTDRLPLRAEAFDPVAAYMWMANTMTGGMAGNYLGLSKPAIEKRMLFQHLKSHQEMLNRSLRVWRMVPDWTAHTKLPDFCRRGIEC